jgi:hypothetical protein
MTKDHFILGVFVAAIGIVAVAVSAREFLLNCAEVRTPLG